MMLAVLLCCVSSAVSCAADEFATVVQPYVNKYCLSCHNSTEAKGELDFTKFASPRDVIDNFRRWSAVLEFVKGGEMPPEDSPQPDPTESARMMESVRSILSMTDRFGISPGLTSVRLVTFPPIRRLARDLITPARHSVSVRGWCESTLEQLS
jgi:hypothetical protein